MEQVDQRKEIALSITRLVVFGLTLLNYYLKSKGLPSIEIGDETIATLIDAVVVIAAGVWVWWKNNNMTVGACAGQQVTDAFKDGVIDDVMIEEYGEEDEESETDNSEDIDKDEVE